MTGWRHADHQPVIVEEFNDLIVRAEASLKWGDRQNFECEQMGVLHTKSSSPVLQSHTLSWTVFTSQSTTIVASRWLVIDNPDTSLECLVGPTLASIVPLRAEG